VIDRRGFISGIVFGLLAAPLAAEGQQAGNVPRIGTLFARSADASIRQAFREGLRDLGWIEGQNILVEERWADGQYDRLPALAAELVKLNVQVIVATSTPEIRAAKQATSTIPIVMVIGADPVAEGFIENVRRPGGNITGTAFAPDPAIAGKYIEFLRDVIPGLRRVGQLIDRGQPDIIYRNAFAQAALKLGLTVQTAEVGTPNDIERAFALITEAGARAVWIHGSSLFFEHRRQIAAVAAKHKLADIYIAKEWAQAGGLMSYGVNLLELRRGAAGYVDKILKGAKPADLPVEQPAKFELVINLKTAKALGLTIPPSLLLRADQVIE
jgi:putative tryptophan/tyrosine transport system substrate-binding protein